MGKSSSGKSGFAEDLALKSGSFRTYYIATMKIMDEEAAKRRDRHRKMRRGKGFVTLEIPCHIDTAPSLMTGPENCTVLLECIANLVGNVMHEPEYEQALVHTGGGCTGGGDQCEMYLSDLTGTVISLVTKLASKVRHLIVVTSIFEKEGCEKTDDETQTYIRLMDMVNDRLTDMADEVYKIVDIRY